MTDLEITKLCAEAMGYPQVVHHDPRTPPPTPPAILIDYRDGYEIYDPLHDDAQAMALVKRFRLRISQPGSNNLGWLVHIRSSNKIVSGNLDLNRAICECVAKMQAAKTGLAADPKGKP